MKEVWKKVVGHEGVYIVSNLGRVSSVDRIVVTRNRQIRKYSGKVLNQSYDDRGYLKVVLSLCGYTKTFQVHYLVASAFMPEKCYSTNVIDHIDENPSNNRLDNLRVVSQSENIAKHHRLKGKKRGVHRHGNMWRAKFRKENIGSFLKKNDAYECFRVRYLKEYGHEPW